MVLVAWHQKRYFKQTFSKCGKFDFALMILLIYNLWHGSDMGPGMRFEQAKTGLQYILNQCDAPTDFLLFVAHAPAMLKELGDLVPAGHDSRLMDLWEWFKAHIIYFKFEYLVTMGIFTGWNTVGVAFKAYWSVTVFLTEASGLGMDMFAGSSFREKLRITMATVELVSDSG